MCIAFRPFWQQSPFVLLFPSCWLWLALVSSVTAAPVDATPSSPTPRPPPLANAVLAPSLVAAAKRDGIRISGVDVDERGEPAVGDAIVAWIGASEKGVTRQWLVQLRRGIPTEREKKSAESRGKIKYLSWGPIIIFRSQAEALEVWLAGPAFSNESASNPLPAAPARRARVAVPADYLRLGLNQTATVDIQLAQRVKALQRENSAFEPHGIYALEKPIKADAIAHNKPMAEQLGFTPESARAWIGGGVALEAFYLAADEVSMLREIASVAAERPSVLKLAKAAFGTPFLTAMGNGSSVPVDPASFGLLPVTLAAFDLPFGMSLSGAPIIMGDLIVTTPKPPLDVSAGILGLLAIHPKDPSRMLHIAVIASERGKPPPPVAK